MGLRRLIFKQLRLFYLIVVIGFFSSCSYWHKPCIIYLIPDGYEGMIVIAWGQQRGMPKTMEGKYEVYKIPETGFLRTQQDSRNIAPLEERFYSYNSKSGKRTELEIINRSLVTDTITKKNQLYQLNGFSGGHKQGKYMVLYLTKDPESKYLDFTNRTKYDERINYLFKHY